MNEYGHFSMYYKFKYRKMVKMAKPFCYKMCQMQTLQQRFE